MAILVTGCTLDRMPFNTRFLVDSGAADAQGPEDASTDATHVDTRPPDGCVPAIEDCDGVDDDCDGRIDENPPENGDVCTHPMGCVGLQSCLGGVVQCVVEVAELCNGMDDDCDGNIDEQVPGIGDACPTGAGGVCEGIQECVGGAPRCRALSVGAETCDGVDEDCDGNVDESAALPATCDVIPGCRGQSAACSGGEIVCEARQEGSCDDVDEDCDRSIDEGVGSCDACFFERYAGHSYLFCEKAGSWDDSREYCTAHGMRLVAIESRDEQEWIVGRLAVVDTGSRDEWWIGLRLVTGNGGNRDNYRWWPDGMSTPPPEYSGGWASDEPNGSGAGNHCVRFESDTVMWGDRNCSQDIHFICESN